MTQTVYPASTKQLAFIASLASERTWTDNARIQDVVNGLDISGYEARVAIDYLLKQPRRSPLAGLPLAKYAVELDGLPTRFYEVVERRNGARFLNGLIGAPGDWARRKVSYAEQKLVVGYIAADPLAAVKLFSARFTVCGVCSSPLSDPFSIANGIGPVCIKKF